MRHARIIVPVGALLAVEGVSCNALLGVESGTSSTDGGDAASPDAPTDPGGPDSPVPPDGQTDGAANTPRVFAGGLDRPSCVAVDDVNVYWGLLGAGAGGMPKVGTGPFSYQDQNLVYTTDCAVDVLYFFAVMDTHQLFMEFPVGGGTMQGYTAPPTDGIFAVSLASNPFNAYLTNPVSGEIYTCDSMPSCSTLATGQNGPYRIASDATQVYWTNRGDGTVVRLPRGGGTPSMIASSQAGPSGIAVDATAVYWVNQDGSVMRWDMVTLAVAPLAMGPAGAEAIALDATSVYWVTASSGKVMKVAKAGGAPTTLAQGQANPWDIATTDGEHAVYWVNNDADAGAVMSVPK